MAGHASDPHLGPELSIIIVSYNTRDLTLDCLRSVASHPPGVPYEVIVLDNDSRDGSPEAVAAAFPNVRLIRNGSNIGFAAGNNRAAEQAEGRRILLLNSDTVVFERTLPAIWEFAEREAPRRIWGGRTLFGNLTLNPTSCWRRISLWSLFCTAVGLTHLFPRSPIFNSESYGAWQRDSVRDVDIVTGCFLLIDTQLWRQLGGFDETFFMYAEDADLCLRGRRVGARPAITPAAELIHYGGGSDPRGAEKLVKIIRGRVSLLKKHWHPIAFALARLLMLIWAFARLVGSRFKAGNYDDLGTSREKWSELWDRRREWLAGWTR